MATAELYGVAFENPLPDANVAPGRLVPNRWDSIGGGYRRSSRSTANGENKPVQVADDDVHCTLRAAAALVPELASTLATDLARPRSKQLYAYLTLKRLSAIVQRDARGWEVRKARMTVDSLLSLEFGHVPMVVTLNGGHTIAVKENHILDAHETKSLPITYTTLRRCSGLCDGSDAELSVVAARTIHCCRSSRTNNKKGALGTGGVMRA
mmetsp:Transcript_90060/g.257506  ORF Transcript_90060/g.257506 Transcript_90060/m.257506 type:complete len:210 (+) Transcript_90060:610-1239(+)